MRFIPIILSLFITVGFLRTEPESTGVSEILTRNDSLYLKKAFARDLIDSIDFEISRISGASRFSGNVLVSMTGLPVYSRNIGYIDPLRMRVCSAEDEFQLASVSKQFTAAAILKLVDEGRIRLQDTLRKFIPELPYSGITIEQMLKHTSGLPNYMYLVDKYWSDSVAPDNEETIQMMAKAKLNRYFSPGNRFNYSNTGYMLLASIVERVSNMSLNRFLQENFFIPLGMDNTYVFVMNNYNQGPGFADGFRVTRSGYIRIAPSKNNATVGDKGIYSTVTDMYKWVSAVERGQIFDTEKYPEAMNYSASANGKLIPYGYGFRLKMTEGLLQVYHTGTWEGFRNYVGMIPATGNSFILLNNTSVSSHVRMADAIARILAAPRHDISEMLAHYSLRYGANRAIHVYTGMHKMDVRVKVEPSKLENAANYLQESGKPESAKEIRKLIRLVEKEA